MPLPKKRYHAREKGFSGPAPGRYIVYDYETGGVARDADGKLVYRKTLREAKEWADAHEPQQQQPAKAKPRDSRTRAGTDPHSGRPVYVHEYYRSRPKRRG